MQLMVMMQTLGSVAMNSAGARPWQMMVIILTAMEMLTNSMMTQVDRDEVAIGLINS